MITLFISLFVGMIIFIFLYWRALPRENLETLRNPAHLPATIERLTNTILTAPPILSDKIDTLTLPIEVKDNFNDWIEKGLVSPIKDQMLCGGCWAFATCGSLADRLSIATGGRWYAPFGLSEQALISCGGDMGMNYYQGCEGGIPHTAIDVVASNGLPPDSKCSGCSGSGKSASGNGPSRSGVVNPNDTSTCSSGGNTYASTNYTWWQTGCDGSNSCSLAAASSCPCSEITSQMKTLSTDETPFSTKYKTVGEAHGYTTHGDQDQYETVDLWPNIPQSTIDKNVERMKKAIYYEGPITVGYRVTADFYTFWPTASVDNYYKYDGRSQMRGGHAVVIVGWKKLKDGTPVWIVKNSWGENGGYGFPNGPKKKHPITEKTVPKYSGGFWNHIMGINDSFIESNASGAHPDLSIPELQPLLKSPVPADWYKTMTLRDIYKQNMGDIQPVTPIPSPSPTPAPIPTYVPQPIISDKFRITTLAVSDVTQDSIRAYFERTDSIYLIGAESPSTVKKVLELLPISKSQLTIKEMDDVGEKLKQSVAEYLLIGAKGTFNTFYYISGVPTYWNVFTEGYIGRAATTRKLASDMYAKLQGLSLHAPVVQVNN